MTVYIIITVISMLFAKLATNVRGLPDLSRTYKIFCVCSFLPFFITSAIRYNVGTDYWHIYEPYFDLINSGKDRFSEEGFNLLNRIAFWIYDDPAVMFAIVSLIIYTFVFLAIYQQSEHICFSILIFVISATFFNSMNQLRQAISMAIFLYSMKYIYQRRKLPYFLWIAFAFTMHTSALIYVPMYFLYGKKAKLSIHLGIFAGCLIGFPIFKRVLIFAVSHTKYQWYLGSVFDEQNFYLLGFLFAAATLVICYFYYYYGHNEEDLQYNFMLNLMFFGFLALLFSSVIPQSDRIYYCFTYVEILLMPKVVFSERLARRRIVLYMGIFVFYTVKLLYDVYVNGWYYVVPYQTLFSR